MTTMQKPAVSGTGFTLMMVSAFLCYLAMVMPLSCLAVQVSRAWGMSDFMAGLAAGAAFMATILCRKRGGDLSDREGGRVCFIRGSLWNAAGGIVCLAATLDALPVALRFAALIAGRLLIGVGESMTNVGMNHWVIGLMGVERAAFYLGIIGVSLYGAVAVGGVAGFYLYSRAGFHAVMLVCALAPIVAFAIAGRSPGAPHAERAAKNSSVLDVFARIWRLGLPACLVATGFAVIGAFISKSFVDRGWPHAGWGLTMWGVGYVVVRFFAGNLPDRIGGLPVTAASAAAEAVGLCVLSLLAGPYVSLLGCFLVGAGMSMVFPSLMAENVRSVPPALRGAAMSCFNIFVDIAYAFTGPVAGLFTGRFGDRVAYMGAAVAVVAGLFLVCLLIRRQKTVR